MLIYLISFVKYIEKYSSKMLRQFRDLYIYFRQLLVQLSLKFNLYSCISTGPFVIAFKNLLIIHEQNTKEIIAVKESFYVIKHTWIFTKLLPQFSRLIQHLH